jgi:hypothetical protein
MAIFSGVLSRIYSQADSLGYTPRQDLASRLSQADSRAGSHVNRLRAGSHGQNLGQALTAILTSKLTDRLTGRLS